MSFFLFSLLLLLNFGPVVAVYLWLVRICSLSSSFFRILTFFSVGELVSLVVRNISFTIFDQSLIFPSCMYIHFVYDLYGL